MTTRQGKSKYSLKMDIYKQMQPVLCHKSSNQAFINYIDKITKELSDKELYFVYQSWNMIIDAVSRQARNVYLSEDQTKTVIRSFIENKQLLVKLIHRHGRMKAIL